MKIISANNVTLSINKRSILQNLSLDIMQGETLTLLGLNGAGKSSLIRILSGLQKPTQGEVSYGSSQSKRAYVDQNISIDQFMSIKDNFIFQGKMYHLNCLTIRERMEYLIEAFDLLQFLHKPIPFLSGGMKRRVDLAVNLISYPDILFLDEPTTSLDIQAKKQLWKQLRKFQDRQNTTVILTTHDLEEAEYLSSRIVFLNDGQIVRAGTPETLNQILRQEKIVIYAERCVQEHIFKILNDTYYESNEQSLEIWTANPDQLLHHLIHLIDEKQLCIDGIIKQKQSLNDLFVIFMKGALANDQRSKANNQMALV